MPDFVAETSIHFGRPTARDNAACNRAPADYVDESIDRRAESGGKSIARTSRIVRILTSRRRLVQLALLTLLIGFVVFAAAMLLDVVRMSRRIVDKPGRHPIESVSAVRSVDSEPIVLFYGDDWRVTRPVDLHDLPEYVPQAFVAAEDVRFYHHPGIDPIGLARAMFVNVRHMRLVQGGSTITQQLIKQKLFSNQRTFRRKIPEMLLAIVLTAEMSKADILEGYLNDVYLGQYGGAPVLGIDEASQMYFSKSPTRLTVDEAALLAASIRAPNRVNPVDQPAAAKTRRDAILATMHDHKWITDEQFNRATARPIHLHPGELADAPFGHYLSAARTELATEKARIPENGIRVICEIDPRAQQAAEETARRAIAELRSRYPWLRNAADLKIAILSADPRSGGVRALVGSRDFASDAYDRTRRMVRQPGSALKPFIYAAALGSRKFTNVSILLDEPLQVKLARNRYWSPQDYDQRFRGPVTLRVALEQSLNVPTVRLAQQVGLDYVADELDDFGFEEK